jgi:hypothetical protein
MTTIWKGKAITTIGDLGDALTHLQSEEEGQAFMTLYRAQSQYADVNVGYMSGYYDHETMVRIQQFTHTPHPVTGFTPPPTTTFLNQYDLYSAYLAQDRFGFLSYTSLDYVWKDVGMEYGNPYTTTELDDFWNTVAHHEAHGLFIKEERP